MCLYSFFLFTLWKSEAKGNKEKSREEKSIGLKYKR